MGAGQSLVPFSPLDNEPPSSNYAALSRRNGHPILVFDGSTNESAIFTGIMAQNYSGGGVTVYIHYAMNTATSSDTDWDVSFERIGDEVQDIDSDGFASALSANGNTVPGTAGLVDVVSIPFSDGAAMDSIAVGDTFRLKLTRDAVSDGATDDAHVTWVDVRET